MKRIRSSWSLDDFNLSPFTEEEIKEIEAGIESGVDVSLYVDEMYGSKEMHWIRLGLEAGVDAAFYATSSFDADEMKKIYERMLEYRDIMNYRKGRGR